MKKSIGKYWINRTTRGLLQLQIFRANSLRTVRTDQSMFAKDKEQKKIIDNECSELFFIILKIRNHCCYLYRDLSIRFLFFFANFIQ